VGEAPALWAWLRLLANQDNLDCMPEVLASRRLQALRRIEVWEVSEELLQAVIKHPELKVMELDADLSSLHPELLAQAVTQLEEVELSNGQVTIQQAAAICTAILGNSRLKRLELTNLDLSSVEAPIMAQAVTELEELSLCNTRLTSQQAVSTFSAIDSATKLRILKKRPQSQCFGCRPCGQSCDQAGDGVAAQHRPDGLAGGQDPRPELRLHQPEGARPVWLWRWRRCGRGATETGIKSYS